MPNKPRTGKNIKCLNCKDEFYIPKNRFKTARFCSRKCSSTYLMDKYTISCDVCHNDFDVISTRAQHAKYCSRKCYHRAMHLKGSVVKNCHHCSKEFKSSPSENRKYCSRKCVNKENKKTFKPSFMTVRKMMISRGMIDKCNRCGYDENKNILGVHHKDRNRDNNKLENLEILCPNCHSLEHNKHICQ